MQNLIVVVGALLIILFSFSNVGQTKIKFVLTSKMSLGGIIKKIKKTKNTHPLPLRTCTPNFLLKITYNYNRPLNNLK